MLLLSNAVVSYHSGMMNREQKSEYNRLYRIANKARIEARRAERKANPDRRCRVPGCERAYDSNGYCAQHYMAFRRNGDPTMVKQHQIHGRTLAERWAAYVERSDGCWEWTGTRNPAGYGVLRIGEGTRLAHRISYSLEHGKIPVGLGVLHTCDNPGCVRPDHLFLGTNADNNADMRAKGRGGAPSLKGSTNPNALLTEAIVRQIRKSKARGTDLASRYGVTDTTISDIRHWRSWRHVK